MRAANDLQNTSTAVLNIVENRGGSIWPHVGVGRCNGVSRGGPRSRRRMLLREPADLNTRQPCADKHRCDRATANLTLPSQGTNANLELHAGVQEGLLTHGRTLETDVRERVNLIRGTARKHQCPYSDHVRNS